MVSKGGEVKTMEVDVGESRGEGLKQYYITKIEELQLIVSDKTQNLRRLQAQRNELNAKGIYDFIAPFSLMLIS